VAGPRQQDTPNICFYFYWHWKNTFTLSHPIETDFFVSLRRPPRDRYYTGASDLFCSSLPRPPRQRAGIHFPRFARRQCSVLHAKKRRETFLNMQPASKAGGKGTTRMTTQRELLVPRLHKALVDRSSYLASIYESNISCNPTCCRLWVFAAMALRRIGTEPKRACCLQVCGIHFDHLMGARFGLPPAVIYRIVASL
jgi:hypothetical protein